MSGHRRRGAGGDNRDQGDDGPDLRQAADRVNRAVEDLMVTASDRLSSHADRLSRSAEQVLNDTTAKLKGSNQHRASSGNSTGVRRKFLRSRRNRKIAGVCGGLAEYFEVESWVVRCIAVTGLIFMPQITFIGYWVTVLMTKRAPRNAQVAGKVDSSGLRDHRSPAPELGPRLSPRNSMGNIRAGFDQMELRLRRAEGYVTSNRYNLDRELHRLQD